MFFKIPKNNEKKKIESVLRELVSEMTEMNYSRVPVFINKLHDDASKHARFISNSALYYPEESFCDVEKSLVDSNINYEVASLILNERSNSFVDYDLDKKNVLNNNGLMNNSFFEVKYPVSGLEIIKRVLCSSRGFYVVNNEVHDLESAVDFFSDNLSKTSSPSSQLNALFRRSLENSLFEY